MPYRRLAIAIGALVLLGCSLPSLPVVPSSPKATAKKKASPAPSTAASKSPSPAPSSSPSASPSVKPSASASPAAASPSPSPSASASAGAGTVLGLWKVGKKWEYTLTAQAAGQTTTSTMTREVMKIEGTQITVKTTVQTAAGAPSSSTVVVDGTLKEVPPNAANDVTLAVTSTSQESVTVAAGTYANATKKVYSMSGATTGTQTVWSNEEVGLIKSVSTTSVPGVDLTSTSTIELKQIVEPS